MACRTLRSSSGLRDRPHSVADRRRCVLFHAPGRRSLSQGGLPHRRGHDRPARSVSRADRNRDLRQDRRGRQHHQRHRRTSIGFVRGRLDHLCRVSSGQGQQRGGPGSARQGERRAAAAAAQHPAASRREIRPRCRPGTEHRRQRETAGSRGHGVRRQSPAPSDRECERRWTGPRARRSSAAGQHLARRRQAPLAQPHRHRRVTRAPVAEHRDPRRAHGTGSPVCHAADSGSCEERGRVQQHRRPGAERTSGEDRRRRSRRRRRGRARDDRKCEWQGNGAAAGAAPIRDQHRRGRQAGQREARRNQGCAASRLRHPRRSGSLGIHRSLDPQRRRAPRRGIRSWLRWSCSSSSRTSARR